MVTPMASNKIMLFSADESMANAMFACLDEAGYKVFHRSCGSGAIDLIQAEQPAAVILDIELPDLNSLAITRLIRANPSGDRMPVILVGSNMKEEDVLLGLEVGADLCLRETFHPDVFIARMRSLLRRFEAGNKS